jgi:outer membrane protein assembly factor BamB
MKATVSLRNTVLSLLVALPLLALAPGSLAAAPPIWTLQLERSIDWFKASPSGIFLVGTDQEILGVAPDSGTVAWRIRPGREFHGADVELLDGTPFAVLGLGKDGASTFPSLSLLDLRDGRMVWNADSLGLLRSAGSFQIPGTQRLLLRAALRKGRTAALLDMSSGRPIWVNRRLGEELEPVLEDQIEDVVVVAHQNPLMDTDSTMIFHMSRTRFEKYNLNTGELIWDSKNPGPKRSYWEGAIKDEKHRVEFGYAPMVISAKEDRFYAPYMRTVASLSLATGERLWSEPPRLDGYVVQMAETPVGLLLRATGPKGDLDDQKLRLLDRETGATLWETPKAKKALGLSLGHWGDATNFLLEKDRVVIAAEGKLLIIDLQTGNERTLAKLEFRDEDHAKSLLRASEGYCVLGASNLGIYAFADGRRTKSYSCDTPDNFGLGLGLLAGSAALWAIGSVQVGSHTTMSASINPMAGVGEIMKDFSASRESESYIYFLAKVGDERKPGIARVRSETGEGAGEIVLDKKKPEYALDSGGRLFFRDDSKTIHCYRF